MTSPFHLGQCRRVALTNPSKLPISLVVITFNEHKNIERCLTSVPFAKETLVVDSFSTDGTSEIAERLGAKVIQQKWLGFGAQKDFAVQSASYDWILSLDADEALSPEAAVEIQQIFFELDPRVGYRSPRMSYHLGRWIRHGGWYPDWQLRLFHRRHSKWKQVPIHELVESPQRKDLKQPILHFVFESLADQVNTNNRYSSLQAQDHVDSGKKFSWFKFLTKPWVKFLECYFLKQGFRDGFAGFVIAVGAGYSVFIRWVKIWELTRPKLTGAELTGAKGETSRVESGQ